MKRLERMQIFLDSAAKVEPVVQPVGRGSEDLERACWLERGVADVQVTQACPWTRMYGQCDALDDDVDDDDGPVLAVSQVTGVVVTGKLTQALPPLVARHSGTDQDSSTTLLGPATTTIIHDRM